MRKKYFTLFTALLLFTTNLVYSQFMENKDQVFEKVDNSKNVLAKAEKLMQNNQPAFEENKGQITGEDASKVKYVFKKSELSVFLMQTGIAYQFTKTHHVKKDEKIDKTNPFYSENKHTKNFLSENTKTETYRMDVELVGANLNAKITTEGKSEDYTMYYNHNALNVHSYTKITYYNIYPYIDWVIYTHENSLKYDFIIHPGGNPEQIKIKTKWVENLQVTKSGSLQLKNQMGVITEKTPVSFQENEKIKTEFIVKEDMITFKLDSYNKEKTLIIDPTLQWATYYGGGSYDQGYACAVDGLGNVYLAGEAHSSTAISSGGHQNTYGGISDAFLVKFNFSGTNMSLNLGNDTTLCNGNTHILDATTPGATYIWQDASTNSTYTVTTAGIYWVDVTTGNCTVRDSINILYFQSPIVNLGVDTILCDNRQLFIDVSYPDASYLWNDASTLPTKTIGVAGHYSVKITNSCGTTSDTINIKTKDCSCNIFLPNTFTPNKDGFNNVFDPEISCDFELFEFRIFNRYGEQIVMSTDKNVTWDGTHKGIKSPIDTYVWSMRYQITGETKIQTKIGHVNLLK